jgi:hypothetical protein
MIAASWLVLSRFGHCVRQVAADHLARQNLAFGILTSNVKTPNRLNYTGNVVISAPTHASLVPYLTGGVGTQTVFESAELGINNANVSHRQCRCRSEVVCR